MCQHPSSGPISPGSACSVPAVDDTQAGQSLGEITADLVLRATWCLCTRSRERVTVGDPSAHLTYSPPHFTRVFTSVINTLPMDCLTAWRLYEAKRLLITHRLGVAGTCHEVGYTSVGTSSRRPLRDAGAPPGFPYGVADRMAERTQPAVSLLVSAAGGIYICLDTPEGMHRTLGPAPYQQVGTFPRPVPGGLSTGDSLHRHVDGMELPMISGSPWILATILPGGADVHEQLAPTNPLVARLRVPEESVPALVTLPMHVTLPWNPVVLVAPVTMVVRRLPKMA